MRRLRHGGRGSRGHPALRHASEVQASAGNLDGAFDERVEEAWSRWSVMSQHRGESRRQAAIPVTTGALLLASMSAVSYEAKLAHTGGAEEEACGEERITPSRGLVLDSRGLELQSAGKPSRELEIISWHPSTIDPS